MTKYELLYIISAKLEEEKREELIARFADVVTAAGGAAEVSKWGARRLAYPIKFQQEGYYVQMNFSAPEELPAELERQMRLLDTILRFIIVKKVENKLTAKAEQKREEMRKTRDAAAAAEVKKSEAEAEAKKLRELKVKEIEPVTMEEVIAITETEIAAEKAVDGTEG